MGSLGSLGYGRYRRDVRLAGLGQDIVDPDPWGNIGTTIGNALSQFINQLGVRLPGIIAPPPTTAPPSFLTGLPAGLPMMLLIGGAIYLFARR